MIEYKYLIIGGGMTAEAAIRGIREIDPEGSIGVIGAETHAPYDRPPLTKGLWKGKPLEEIYRAPDGISADLHLGRTATALDPEKKLVTDDLGTDYQYDKLLLATGGTPRHLPFGGDQIIYYRTLDDYQRLRTQTDAGQRIAVIGGGFIGSEIAAGLSMVGVEVLMLFPEEGIGWLIFPKELSLFLNDFYRDKGVKVLAQTSATGLELDQDGLTLITDTGQRIQVDAVVAGIGIQPNLELAQAAGLEIENGVVVDERLRTSRPDIYAAGDVAAFYNPALGRRIRVEHEDNANTMGKVAGQNMAGEPVPYHHLPFFYSDLFELGYEAVGDLDSRLETVIDWQEPYRKGFVYYLQNGRIQGVLLWDNWGKVDAARKLISDAGTFQAEDLKGILAS